MDIYVYEKILCLPFKVYQCLSRHLNVASISFISWWLISKCVALCLTLYYFFCSLKDTRSFVSTSHLTFLHLYEFRWGGVLYLHSVLFFKLNFLRMILLKNTCVDECLVLSVSPFCTLLLLTVKWEQRVGGESDWNSLWSNDCKLWKLRGFSNHSWMCWRVNVGRLRNGGERGCGDSIVSGALSKALQPLMVELFWHWIDT